jgi:excisionase family DNA binding protein
MSQPAVKQTTLEGAVSPSSRPGDSTRLVHEPVLLDVKAVAKLLTCSTRHVYRLCDAGRMPPPVPLGALVRWRRQEIEDWIAGGCKPIRVLGRRDR